MTEINKNKRKKYCEVNFELRKEIEIACLELGIKFMDVDIFVKLPLGSTRHIKSVYQENAILVAEALGLDLLELAKYERPLKKPGNIKNPKILEIYNHVINNLIKKVL